MTPKELVHKLEKNIESIANQRDSYKNLCDDKDAEISKLKTTISNLEEQLFTALEGSNNQSSSINPSEESEDVKLKIDGLIGEIDECIALLNN